MNRIRNIFVWFGNIVRTAIERERPSAVAGYIIKESIGQIRSRIAAKVVGWPSSLLAPDARIVGSKGITVGRNASIKRQAWIEAVFAYDRQRFTPLIHIGHHFTAAERLHISAINCVEIGDGCLFGSGIYISDHNHGAYKGAQHSLPTVPPAQRDLVSFGAVKIGNNVWLGDNVVIVGPVTIGDGAVVGANSVVTKDIPGNAISAGAPCKIIKSFEIERGRWERSGTMEK